MNLVWGQAALAPFMALVAVPILIHFFARARPKAYPFSSIRLLEEVVRRTSRIQRPQNWLLLVLRTLLILFLLLAFLRPVWMQENPLAGPMERKSVVILVDASGSMAALDGPRTRFAGATVKAMEVLDGLGSGDAANVIWVRSRPEPVFPGLGVNKQPLREALQKETAAMELAQFPAALVLAESFLAEASGQREIYVISDFQATNWKEGLLRVPEGMRLVYVRVGEEEVPNLAVTKLVPEATLLLAGEEVTVDCEVMNFSGEHALRTIFFRAGEVTESREVRLAPWSSGGVSFLVRVNEPGEVTMQATLDEDRFPADNTRRTMVQVARAVRVGVLGSGAEATTWLGALRSLTWVEVEVIPAGAGKAPEGLDVMVAAGWKGEGREMLERFSDDGKTIILVPGAGLAAEEIGWLLGVEGVGNGIYRMAPEGGALEVAAANHPVLGVFQLGEFGDPALGLVAGRLDAGQVNLPMVEEILRYSDAKPGLAVLKRGEKGAVVWWNLPTGYEVRAEFLPLVGEVILKYRGKSFSVGGVFEAGDRVMRAMEEDVLEDEVELAMAGGTVPLEKVDLGDGRSVMAAIGRLEPGTYVWRYQGKEIGASVVNFPRDESDLRLLEGESLGGEGATVLEAGTSVRQWREGVPLWPWLVGLALLFALAEGLVLWRSHRVV